MPDNEPIKVVPRPECLKVTDDEIFPDPGELMSYIHFLEDTIQSVTNQAALRKVKDPYQICKDVHEIVAPALKEIIS
jgi:hypothetical protein